MFDDVGDPMAGGKSDILYTCIFFSKVNLGSSRKVLAYIRGVFSFGGILGWAPSPTPPPKKNRQQDPPVQCRDEDA